MIKFGDIDYFTLLDLQTKLKYIGWDRLDLFRLDQLRAEVDRKILQINAEENEKLTKRGN